MGLHDQMFHQGDDDAAATECEQPGVLHAVQGFRHFQPGGIEFSGQLAHQDGDLLGPGGVDAAVQQEADNELLHVGRRPAPRVAAAPLHLRGKQIEQIEADDEEIVEQPQHLVLREGDEVAVGFGGHGGGKLGGGPEEGLRLQQPGCREVLGEGIVVGVALSGIGEPAADEEVELAAAVVFAHHGLPFGRLLKSELGVARDLEQFRAAESLKELELEQMLVELETDGCRLLHGTPPPIRYSDIVKTAATATP